MHRFLSSLLLTLSLLVSITSTIQAQDSQPYVVMLSLDGFRWDYAQHCHTPNLDSIAAAGVMVEKLRPSFPTKTFPNHYSIATGLYPDNHGIVLNDFYDPATDRVYRVRDRDAVEDGTFYSGEPIWNTAEKQGIISGSYFWVGSEADIQGTYPTYTKRYDHKFPYEQRIDSVIAWLSLPEEQRPHLLMWYFDEPDGVGHEYGPLTPECNIVIERLDSLIGVFLTKARKLEFYDEINFIFLSDHGMCPISPDRTVILSDHIQRSWVDKTHGSNPVMVMRPEEEYLDTVYSILSKIEHISVWRSDEVPERLHFGSNPRALDLVIASDSAWIVSWRTGGGTYRGGTHGFDNDILDMQAIFYAAGPAFKQGYIHPGFDNIDIYPLICQILKLEPAEVDGKLEHTLKLLKE